MASDGDDKKTKETKVPKKPKAKSKANLSPDSALRVKEIAKAKATARRQADETTGIKAENELAKLRYVLKKSSQKVRDEWEHARKTSATRKRFIEGWQKDPTFEWLETIKEKNHKQVKKKKREREWKNKDQIASLLGWTGHDRARDARATIRTESEIFELRALGHVKYSKKYKEDLFKFQREVEGSGDEEAKSVATRLNKRVNVAEASDAGDALGEISSEAISSKSSCSKSSSSSSRSRSRSNKNPQARKKTKEIKKQTASEPAGSSQGSLPSAQSGSTPGTPPHKISTTTELHALTVCILKLKRYDGDKT